MTILSTPIPPMIPIKDPSARKNNSPAVLSPFVTTSRKIRAPIAAATVMMALNAIQSHPRILTWRSTRVLHIDIISLWSHYILRFEIDAHRPPLAAYGVITTEGGRIPGYDPGGGPPNEELEIGGCLIGLPGSSQFVYFTPAYLTSSRRMIWTCPMAYNSVS